jgi:hypothetical protein
VKSGSGSGTDEFAFPAPSSPAKDGGKRKKEAADGPESGGGGDGKKRKRTSSDSDESSSSAAATPEDVKPPLATAAGTSSETATVVPKREPKPSAVVFSYKMLECPRKDCSKQYKHDEGLKWHLSHSHPEYIGPDGEVSGAQFPAGFDGSGSVFHLVFWDTDPDLDFRKTNKYESRRYSIYSQCYEE